MKLSRKALKALKRAENVALSVKAKEEGRWVTTSNGARLFIGEDGVARTGPGGKVIDSERDTSGSGAPKKIEARNSDGDLQTFRVGDTVGFKRDVEQVSVIHNIRQDQEGEPEVLVDVTEGDYGRGRMWEYCSDTWPAKG